MAVALVIDTTMLERTIAAADTQALLGELSYLNGIASTASREAKVAFDAAKENPAAFLRAYLAGAVADCAGQLFDALNEEIVRRKEVNHDHHHR